MITNFVLKTFIIFLVSKFLQSNSGKIYYVRKQKTADVNKTRHKLFLSSGSTSKSLCSSDADEPNTASSEAADNSNAGSSRKKKRRKKSDRKYSRYELF